MPGKSKGPDGKASVQGPSSRIDRKSLGKHTANYREVREQETQAPHYVDVAIVLLELAE